MSSSHSTIPYLYTILDRPIAADGCGKRPSAASSSSSSSSSTGGSIGTKTTLGAAKPVLRKTSSKSSDNPKNHENNRLKYSHHNSKSADDLRRGNTTSGYSNNQLTPAKRGVSFSSIVMVKVIGSASLGIGRCRIALLFPHLCMTHMHLLILSWSCLFAYCIMLNPHHTSHPTIFFSTS